MAQSVAPPETGFEFINTSFENASPLYWKVEADGVIQLYLVYDHERASPNRANHHWHFQIQARPGAHLTLVFNNLENIYNGRPAGPVSKERISVISENGRDWRPAPMKLLPGNRLQLDVEMTGANLFVARVEPYRLANLDRFLDAIRKRRQVEITTIGQTVEGRPLEIIRIGNPQAPYRLLLRARAHAWEPVGNFIVQGLVNRLLKGDAEAQEYLARYCVYILPMANKDAVARGLTRFNRQGVDLNRHWDKPADAALAPENHALETWLAAMKKKGLRLHLGVELHNDEAGGLHATYPDGGDWSQYLARMTVFAQLLRQHGGFADRFSTTTFRGRGTFTEGLLTRYGTDGVLYEFNSNWFSAVQDYPSGKYWEAHGALLCRVFSEYFATLKP